MSSIKTKLGKRIREIRKCKNLTQEQLSEELNYSPDYVRKLNKDLLKFLQNKLNEQEAKQQWQKYRILW